MTKSQKEIFDAYQVISNKFWRFRQSIMVFSDYMNFINLQLTQTFSIEMSFYRR